MKIKLFFILVTITTSVFAVSTSRDADGVPNVDIHGTVVVVKPATVSGGFRRPEQKVRFIDVGENRMPIKEFFLTYCMGKKTNETCARAQRIITIDMSSGPGKLPNGL